MEGSLHVPAEAPESSHAGARECRDHSQAAPRVKVDCQHVDSSLLAALCPKQAFPLPGSPKRLSDVRPVHSRVSRVSNGTAFQKQTDIPSGQVPQRRPPWGIFSCSSDKKRRGGAAQDWTFQRCQLGEELLLQQPLSPLSSTTREEAAAECYGFSTPLSSEGSPGGRTHRRAASRIEKWAAGRGAMLSSWARARSCTKA